MIFKSSDDLFSFLYNKYKKNDTVDICSYGMYLGISKGKDWHEQYPTPVREFINKVNKKKLRMVIGEPYFLECYKGCSHCKQKFNDTLKRHIETKNILGLDLRFNPTCHLKYYRVGSTVVIGGINLGASTNFDCCVQLSLGDGLKMRKIFNNIYNESKEVPTIK